MPTRSTVAELARLDATDQARLVARGVLEPAELVEAACERIARVDPRLGAVPIRLFEQARAAAEGVGEAPFAGVPFLMKDVGARQAGQPYYAGNRALLEADHRAEEDTVLGARFRTLGLVTVGKSSTPEFGLQSSTWPLAFGPTRNPWDPARSPGGSSGGACAAVAAGLVPVAHASDGAGSIRIPAAWCGLVGLKPSRDRVVWRHAGRGRPDVEFVVARSLRDTAALLDRLAREDDDARPGRFVAALAYAPRALRVGLGTRSPSGPVEPVCVRAAEAAARALEGLGHAVDEAMPEALFEHEERALHGLAFGLAEYRACLEELEERLGRAVEPEDVEPFLWTLATSPTPTADPEAVARALAWNAAWQRRVLGWFARYDVLVTPTVCEPAPPLADLDPERHEPLELLEKMLPHMAFTEPWNATGQPAISLPLAFDASGLPVGVQLVARTGREDLLLGLAAALLEDAPLRTPAVHA
jgi:amidase